MSDNVSSSDSDITQQGVRTTRSTNKKSNRTEVNISGIITPDLSVSRIEQREISASTSRPVYRRTRQVTRHFAQGSQISETISEASSAAEIATVEVDNKDNSEEDSSSNIIRSNSEEDSNPPSTISQASTRSLVSNTTSTISITINMAGYENWSFEADISADSGFMTSSNIRAIVNRLRKTNFAIQSGRDTGFAIISELVAPLEPIVSENRRFPETGLYICLGDKEFENLVSSIRGALQYRDPANVAGRQGGAGPSGGTDWNYNDAQNAFFKSVLALGRFISESSVIWNRRIFEARFSLVWRPAPVVIQ